MTVFYLFTEIDIKSFVNLNILIDYLLVSINQMGKFVFCLFTYLFSLRYFYFRDCCFEGISSIHTHTYTHTKEERVMNPAHLSSRLNNYPLLSHLFHFYFLFLSGGSILKQIPDTDILPFKRLLDVWFLYKSDHLLGYIPWTQQWHFLFGIPLRFSDVSTFLSLQAGAWLRDDYKSSSQGFE